MVQSMLEKFGRAFIFSQLRDPLHEYVLKAGYEKTPYKFFAWLFFAINAIAAVGLWVLFFNARTAAIPWLIPLSQYLVPSSELLGLVAQAGFVIAYWIFVSLGLIAFIIFFIWSYFNLRIYRRTKDMEERLPDYLGLVVTNLRSGMSFDKSLWGAIRPEFGVLGREITIVSKKVMTGNDTAEALNEFAMRYDSPILRRSISLIISELESGGEVASVIDRVINNLRQTHELKREMATSVVSYMMFISVIVLVLSPILFALANTILDVILSFAQQIAGSGGGPGGQVANVFESLGNLATRRTEIMGNFQVFSYMAITTISVCAGIIVSILEKGDILGGIKYVPVFGTVSILVFILALRGLESLFGMLT